MGLQKLVMVYSFGDGYTFSYEKAFPILSESLEQAFCDFEEAYLEGKKQHKEFTFAGQSFDSGDFEEQGVYYPPSFMTVDDWFESELGAGI